MLGLPVALVIVIGGLVVAIVVLGGVVIPNALRRARARGGGTYNGASRLRGGRA